MRIGRRVWVLRLGGGRCVVCGESDLRCLEFHHRDPKTKRFCVMDSLARTRQSLTAEIEKCSLLCSNCHSKLHRNLEDYTVPESGLLG
jgi:hypothetical protein